MDGALQTLERLQSRGRANGVQLELKEFEKRLELSPPLENSYSSVGHYKYAIGQYEMHLKTAQEIGDKTGEGSAIENLGNCFISLGQYQKAIERYEIRLVIAKQIGDKTGEAHATGLGQYQKAI